jgi:mono/diheme cytochrome c family protein
MPTAMIATTKPRAWRLPALAAIIGVLVAGALLCPALQAQTATGGSYFVPGDPKLGMRTFFDKGCARCHSVLGEGGRSAPDLARAPAGHLSSAELLAAMWNHAPSMWEKMRVEGVSPPKFTEGDMANLFAFLYSVRSLDEPGDPGRGRRLLEDKNCLQCHRAGGTGGGSGPDLAKWASYRNPVSWVQAMWNHAPAMQSRMSARGVKWPQFEGNDVPDLIAYIRVLSPNASKPTYLRPADTQAGRRIFREKGCAVCHAISSSSGSGAPDQRSRALPRTLGQFAAAMWNHAPAMRASMQAQNIPRPQFTNKEMADLIAYLFAERYFEPSGNVARGARLFDDKGCAACHRAGGVGPELSHASFSPSHMAAALWNHGPAMFQTMQQQQIAWPRFQPGEVVDLIEFLSSRAAPTRAIGGQR